MKKQKISVTTLGLLLFVTVFGISNVANNYGELGNSAIGWFILLGIYFVPLALIIAELSSKNPDTRSGMNAWISEGLGEKWAFIGVWSYFIANIFYIPMLASRIPIMLSWVFTADIQSLDQVVSTSGQIDGVINATSNQGTFLIMAIIVCLIGIVLAVLFENVFAKLGTIIGWLTLFVTGLFIFMALLAIPVFGLDIANPITISSAMPKLNVQALSTFAWILFAISGIETIGSYVGLTDDAEKQIPRGITFAAILIIGAYVIGFIAMAFILTPEQMPVDHLENMTQIMYAQVFSMWGLGPIALRIVMFIYSLITITALVLWMTSTITAVFSNFPAGILSEKVRNAKINGLPTFGLVLTGAMIIIFVIISNSGVSGNIYTTLYDMSTIAVILPYVLISLSYIVFKSKKNDAPFKMVKNDTLAKGLGIMIFAVTLVAIIFSSFDLTITEMSDRMSWFMVSFGGIGFFLLIGVAVYNFKVNIDVSFILLIGLFLVASVAYSLVLGLVAIVLAVYYGFNRQNLIKRQKALLANE